MPFEKKKNRKKLGTGDPLHLFWWRVSSPHLQALNKYGRDLVADAEGGKLDPVIGRDEEIRRVIQVGSGLRVEILRYPPWN